MGKQIFVPANRSLERYSSLHVKDLTTFSFSKEIKRYLLSEQYSKVTLIEILLLTIT